MPAITSDQFPGRFELKLRGGKSPALIDAGDFAALEESIRLAVNGKRFTLDPEDGVVSVPTELRHGKAGAAVLLDLRHIGPIPRRRTNAPRTCTASKRRSR